MAQLIDTSILITLERRGWPLSRLAATAPDEPVALASITASELLMGVYRANTPERQARRSMFVEALLGRLPVLPFDLEVARHHAQLWAELVATGQIIGAHDLLIAATAAAHGYAVLTENAREFHRVPGLVVHQPDWSAGPDPVDLLEPSYRFAGELVDVEQVLDGHIFALEPTSSALSGTHNP